MKEFQALVDHISRHISLTAHEAEQVVSVLQYRKLKKRQFLLHEGQVSTSAAFVTSGCLRAYSVDVNGFEHILQFAPEQWWVADMFSLITGEPGNLYIDALEDTEVILFPRAAQEALFDTVPRLERYFRIITEKSLASSRQRIIENLSMQAAERYALFCHTYPTLINTIPQRQIAAYIGVTPEFLSKLRKQHPRG